MDSPPPNSSGYINTNQVKKELLLSVSQLSERGLVHGSKWLAELLYNVTSNHKSSTKDETAVECPDELKDDSQDIETYLLAKAYFDTREYHRAAHILADCEGRKAIFLRNYSLYLAGEKRKEEEEAETNHRSPVVNRELKGIKETLHRLFTQGRLDPFGKYLYGIVLGKSQDLNVISLNRLAANKATSTPSTLNTPIKNFGIGSANKDLSGTKNINSNNNQMVASLVPKEEDEKTDLSSHESAAFQRALLISSIRQYPWNWCVWVELAEMVQDGGMLSRIEPLLPNHYIKPFWHAHTHLLLLQNQAALEVYNQLNMAYPNNFYITAQLAVVLHNLGSLDPAEELFETLRIKDPHRLTNMDTYSNILYLKTDTTKLSYLAHQATMIDKYTPETCCITGNYYALAESHDKAIKSFERALALDPNYLDAWTLIGHEYMELRATDAARRAYRKAIDINRRDYRAWYALGQTYELEKKPQYAMYYYERACELRPYDSRMWCALGGCYEATKALENALLCYKRAESNQDKEGVVLHKLAELYNLLGKEDEAALYYKKNLDAREKDSASNLDQIRTALSYLTRYHHERKNLQEAYKYCSKLIDYRGNKKDEDLEALMREINATQMALSGNNPATVISSLSNITPTHTPQSAAATHTPQPAVATHMLQPAATHTPQPSAAIPRGTQLTFEEDDMEMEMDE